MYVLVVRIDVWIQNRHFLLCLVVPDPAERSNESRDFFSHPTIPTPIFDLLADQPAKFPMNQDEDSSYMRHLWDACSCILRPFSTDSVGCKRCETIVGSIQLHRKKKPGVIILKLSVNVQHI